MNTVTRLQVFHTFFLQPIERWWRTCRQMGIQHFMDFFNTLEAQGHLESGNDMDL